MTAKIFNFPKNQPPKEPPEMPAADKITSIAWKATDKKTTHHDRVLQAQGVIERAWFMFEEDKGGNDFWMLSEIHTYSGLKKSIILTLSGEIINLAAAYRKGKIEVSSLDHFAHTWAMGLGFEIFNAALQIAIDRTFDDPILPDDIRALINVWHNYFGDEWYAATGSGGSK